MKPYGKLIGASLGPGDPDLITRRAWSALQSGARWLYPVKKAEESSYALSIVERSGLAIPADAVELERTRLQDAAAGRREITGVSVGDSDIRAPRRIRPAGTGSGRRAGRRRLRW